MLLIFALHCVVLSITLRHDIDTDIRAFEAELCQQLVGNILEQPDVLQFANMFEILDAELLEDVTADLLVITRPHLREGVCRFIVPFLAFGEEEVEETYAIRPLA